jgi:hypothetical protein
VGKKKREDVKTATSGERQKRHSLSRATAQQKASSGAGLKKAAFRGIQYFGSSFVLVSFISPFPILTELCLSEPIFRRRLKETAEGAPAHRKAALPTATAGTRIVPMLQPGQQVRVNLAGMQVGSVVFHVWVLSSGRFPKILRSIWSNSSSLFAGWTRWKCQRIGLWAK